MIHARISGTAAKISRTRCLRIAEQYFPSPGIRLRDRGSFDPPPHKQDIFCPAIHGTWRLKRKHPCQSTARWKRRRGFAFTNHSLRPRPPDGRVYKGAAGRSARSSRKAQAQSLSVPLRIPSPCGRSGRRKPSSSRQALGLPGRLMMRLFFRIPAV